MNTKNILLILMITSRVFGQGTMYVYDQQSSVDGSYLEGAGPIQQNQPIGQSFTPQLSNVGFIRLYVYNGYLGNLSSANIVINLRSGSLDGAILGTSAVVTIPSGDFAGLVDFSFTTPVSVMPGTTYYFQPVVQNNNNLGLLVADYGYAGGTAIFNDVPNPNRDLWFREGIIVPEPSSVSLILLAGGTLIYLRRGKVS
jgi:hypothetical protein